MLFESSPSKLQILWMGLDYRPISTGTDLFQLFLVVVLIHPCVNRKNGHSLLTHTGESLFVLVCRFKVAAGFVVG